MDDVSNGGIRELNRDNKDIGPKAQIRHTYFAGLLIEVGWNKKKKKREIFEFVALHGENSRAAGIGREGHWTKATRAPTNGYQRLTLIYPPRPRLHSACLRHRIKILEHRLPVSILTPCSNEYSNPMSQ